jgi:hypothetical protein
MHSKLGRQSLERKALRSVQMNHKELLKVQRTQLSNFGRGTSAEWSNGLPVFKKYEITKVRNSGFRIES